MARKHKHVPHPPKAQDIVRPITGEILLYAEVIKIREGDSDIPRYLPGRITHQLSIARKEYACFEKIHGEFMLERVITPMVSEILIRPFGACVKNGEIYFTGDKKDRLEPVWIRFRNDPNDREMKFTAPKKVGA